MQTINLCKKRERKQIDLFKQFDENNQVKLRLIKLTKQEKLNWILHKITEFDIRNFINRKNYNFDVHKLSGVNEDLAEYFDTYFSDLFAENRNLDATGLEIRQNSDKYYTIYFARRAKPDTVNPSWKEIRRSIIDYYLSKVGYKLETKN